MVTLLPFPFLQLLLSSQRRNPEFLTQACKNQNTVTDEEVNERQQQNSEKLENKDSH